MRHFKCVLNESPSPPPPIKKHLYGLNKLNNFVYLYINFGRGVTHTSGGAAAVGHHISYILVEYIYKINTTKKQNIYWRAQRVYDEMRLAH